MLFKIVEDFDLLESDYRGEGNLVKVLIQILELECNQNLSSSYQLHHINGIHTDFSLSNIALLPISSAKNADNYEFISPNSAIHKRHKDFTVKEYYDFLSKLRAINVYQSLLKGDIVREFEYNAR